ncbi:outer membrane beta-barrel protein [Mucilaginibacter sp. OK098]|uniref:outer membrane beta-barrel protein n=1 Tax=Mucilaginibacter sp. OK098 TaxID=1855297 RepID=UPI000912DF7D|nr:outer membrane beta-barrel protein [Mucilaginibacter sp. OK098]SHN34814.1 Outer membrane protein beta-barrel domain-containing protein [Mucilaginibacter sp. OK098]
MKSTLKISALILAFAGLTLGAKAQTSTTSTTKTSTSSNGVILSIGVDAGIPTGKLSDSYNWNIGGSVQADLPIAQNLFVTVNAGYNSIQGKKNVAGSGLDATNIQLLPVKAGLKYFVVPHFYVQGEAGAAFALNKSDVGFDKSAAFVYAPQIGYQFPIGGKNFIDAGVRYEASTKFNSNIDDSKVNFFGLRVAYAFGL